MCSTLPSVPSQNVSIPFFLLPMIFLVISTNYSKNRQWGKDVILSYIVIIKTFPWNMQVCFHGSLSTKQSGRQEISKSLTFSLLRGKAKLWKHGKRRKRNWDRSRKRETKRKKKRKKRALYISYGYCIYALCCFWSGILSCFWVLAWCTWRYNLIYSLETYLKYKTAK